MSGTASGVTLDLSALNVRTYDVAANVASLGSGGRWRDVFAELGRHGVAVSGGRDGDVGVGGFLPGSRGTWHGPHPARTAAVAR